MVAQPYSVCHIGDASVITVQLSMFVSRHLCTQWVNCKWCVVSNKAKRLSHRHIGCKNLSSADDPMTANQWETPCTRDNRQEVVATANKAQRTYGSSCPYEKKKKTSPGTSKQLQQARTIPSVDAAGLHHLPISTVCANEHQGLKYSP